MTLRPVTVPEHLWQPLGRILHDNGLTLCPVHGAPSQPVRYELRVRKGRIVVSTTTVFHDREIQVLLGMASGHTNGEIGAQLNIAKDTVKTYAGRLFRKLGARDRAHAVYLAYQRGLIGDAAPGRHNTTQGALAAHHTPGRPTP